MNDGILLPQGKCNGCKYLNFALKRCEKDKADKRKEPFYLNSYINAEGFVSVIKPTSCKSFKKNKSVKRDV